MIMLWKGVASMHSVMGIINLNEKEDFIRELTYRRPIASIPFAGRYRVIDFTLSNMVNSGMTEVFIFARDKYRSIMDHVQKGRAWDLDRKNDGLYIFTPISNFFTNVRRSDIEVFRDYLDYVYYSNSEYVIVTPSYMICNINYSDVVRFHIEHEADITVVYKKSYEESSEFCYCDTLIVGKDDEAIDVISDSRCKKNVFMEMYVMKRKLFIDLVNNRVLGLDYDEFKDTVFNMKDNLKIFSYEYKGYLACINSINAYFKRSLELLNENNMYSLFSEDNYVFTKVKDGPPTKYEQNAKVADSLVSSGCLIDGDISNSLIFRSVEVKKDSFIKSSIIMQNCKVEEDTYLENVILDKNVVIKKGTRLTGTSFKPYIVEKGQII